MRYPPCAKWFASWIATWCATGICGCAWLPFGDAYRDRVSQQLNEEARLSEEQGNLLQATNRLREATKVDPADVASRLNLARLHREAGRTSEAIAALREVVALTPDDAKAWAELGELEFQSGNQVAANESLEQALRFNPHMTSALLLKGELEELRQYDNQALELYHRVLALEPQHAGAMLRIARIHMRSDEPMRSTLLLRRICQCRGATQDEIAEARWLLGLAYGQQQRWEDAAESLQITMELTPGAGANELYYLAYAQYQSGYHFEASQVAQQILRIDPQFAPAEALLQSAATISAKPPAGIMLIGADPRASKWPVVPAPLGWDEESTSRIQD